MTSTPLAGTKPLVPGPPLGSTGLTTPSSPVGGLSPDAPPEVLALLQKAQEDALKKKLAGWISVEYEKAKNARSPFERQWHINLAFYSGRQNIAPVTVAGQGFRLIAPKAPPWRVRLVINKIRMAVRTECSKLTSSKPVPCVIPATTEDEDFAAARVAEQILKSAFSSEDHEGTVRRWVWWGCVTGNAYLKSYWDSSKIDERAFVTPPVDPQAAMLAQQVGIQMPPPQPVPAQGKIVVETVNPFQLYVPDLMSEELEDQPFVIHVMTKSPQWVQNNFGITATPDSKSQNSLMESAVLAPAGAVQNFDSCLVKEAWIKPGTHPDLPDGGLITVVGDQVVQFVQNWPLPFEEYPFYPYSGIPTGGFYSESVVTDLLALQKEYNRTKSQMVEIKNMMGKPKLMAYRGSVNVRQISSEPGQAVLVTPGYQMPVVIPGVEVPVSMGNELDRLNSDFDDISGQHEITRGNTPSQVTSGTAINFLQEQDDTKLAYQTAGIERATAKLGRHYLKYAVTFWQDGRLVKIVGRDGDFEAKHWQKNAMEGNTDVVVQSGSALPTSKAARQAFLTDLMAQGFIDPQMGLELLDLGGIDKVLEDFLTDKRQAQRENLKMSEAEPDMLMPLLQPQPVMDPSTGAPAVNPMDGTPITTPPQAPLPVNSWDNHQAHIQFHNQFRKTQQFELLDDANKATFELHVQAHQLAMSMPISGVGGNIVANAPDPSSAPPQDSGPPSVGDTGGPPPDPANNEGAPVDPNPMGGDSGPPVQ